ncbi:dermonecrotic toxin domain-containing protein [Pseudomonas baetica]|uniref:dermonecrotic toxin domain-containing protein n=1 Tax=Pseudomonas baetica TaxID=674054 RepID=UPI003EE911AA
MHALVTAIPGVRDTLDQLLKQELDLDGQLAGLHFFATDLRPIRFVSFIDACAYVLQHPELDPMLDKLCRVTGIKQDHPLKSLTPLQILGRLKTLNPERSHIERWRFFWESRAPRTAISRQQRSMQLYRQHFEAATQLASARKSLSAEQLKILQLMIDPPVGALMLNNQPVNTEQVTLVLSNQSRIKLTGAWVITTAEAASATQLLYLPSRPVAIQSFDQRSDMEAWLSRQSLVPIGLPTTGMRFEYTAQTDPLTLGASDLFAAFHQSQITALRYGTRGKPGLAAHGAQALVQADQVDRQNKKAIFFASPPSLENADNATDADQGSLFGNLHTDVPWSLRQAALKKQRDALQSLVEAEGDGEGLKPVKDSINALESAEKSADKAASSMLNLSRTLEPLAFQRELTALHSAHKAGLLAEIALQLALKQLSDEEGSLIKTLLDTPHDPGSEPVAASLTLSKTEQDGDKTTITADAIKGAFIVTRAPVLTGANLEHSVLLYWLGNGGGLQRFASLRELEHQVFKLDDRDNEVTLQLKKISGDALLHSLNQLTQEFETQATQDAEQLDILRERTLALLQVPVHAARSLAFTQLLEQHRSGTLATKLPDWLRTLNEADRAQLKSLIEAYIVAMRQSHAFMTIALEPRDDFTRKHLHDRLSKDFVLKGQFEVRLSLPDSVTWEKRYTATPSGKVETSVMVPSASRSKMSLEALAQLNIDNIQSVQQDALSQRLVFMTLEVTADDPRERIKLLNGINLTYLRKILPELDLSQAYENLIRQAFMGTAAETVFANEHRRECLIEPWRLTLKLQGEYARLQKQISQADLHILNIAIDADTPEAWRANGMRIVLLPALLTAGGKDTPNEGPVTLSGVTFIEEQISGVTLLYLPDSPDGQVLRRYGSLEDARKALFNLTLRDAMVTYLAGRALHGNVSAHISRMNQAMLNNFDAMIGVGTRWPATTSLAAHLLNAHMGRLIEAHRGASRSNVALYLERYALSGPRAFNYMKMAFGMLPFIGTAIALYDAWTAANRAVQAFLRGDVGDGLAELQSVFMSLIDAAMDLLPGEAVASSLSETARSLTRTRQLQRLTNHVAAMHEVSQRQARHVVQRFAGYEYEKPISLSGLQPAAHGHYRGIYRHVDGDFIERQGRIFKVEFSTDSRNWRLSGSSRRTYKQPIALDEAGRWDTYFGVHGVAFEGGGLGGGNILDNLANTLDPVWPRAIRERLPRWWVDEGFRRHHALTNAADDLALQIDARIKSTNSLLATYNAAPAAERASTLGQQLETACLGDLELAGRYHRTLVELLPLTHGNKRRVLVDFQSNVALLHADRFKQRVFLHNHRIHVLIDNIDALTQKLDALSTTALTERLRVLDDIRKLRLEIIKSFDSIEVLLRDLNHWYQRITVSTHKAQISQDIRTLNGRLTETNILYLRTGNLLEVITRYDTSDDLSWFFLQSQARSIRDRIDRGMFTQYSLPEAHATKAQRNQILQECIESYSEFRRQMNVWTASYPQHFHLETVPPLMDGIEKMAERARKAIDLPAPAAPAGQINKKVFATETDDLLIGVEHPKSTLEKRLYSLTGQGGYEELWEQGSNGKFRLLNPRPQASHAQHRNLDSLLVEARHRLQSVDTYRAKVQSYAARDMLPVDLEHMMVTEADELTRRALRIEELDTRNPLVQTLRDKAIELRTIGREMRTRQSLNTKKPTDGMLDDLVRHKVVEIRKTSPIKNLGKRADGRTDFMQEYEVWDMTHTPPRVLWYAHFHYGTGKTAFSAFEKAHLKLPEHRFLTHADNADLPYADIGKRSLALPHFESL